MKRARREKTTPERLQELRAMRYNEYLRSPEWHARRAVVLRIADNRCQVCNGPGPFNVHHRRYRDATGESILGAEKLADLLCLCEDCHDLFHRYRKLAS